MFYRELIIGFTTIFAWLPALILTFLAAFVFLMGFAAISEGDYLIATTCILLSSGGVLGFIALTSLCWGLHISFLKRLIFLLAGVLSLATVIYLGTLDPTSALYLSYHPLVVYLFYSPFVIGLFHIVLHCYFWVRLPNKSINTRCARWGQKHVGSRRFA